MSVNVSRTVLLFCWISVSILQAGELITPGAEWRYFKGNSEASNPADSWWHSTFSDASWPRSKAPFYYGEPITGGTVLADMQNRYSSIFLRRTFNVAALDSITTATLDVQCDDGFIAWINGRQVASTNAPASPAFNALARANAAEPAVFNAHPVPTPSTTFRQGENVLAIQLFNVALNSSDIVFDAQLITTERETTAPTLVAITPFPGTVTNLTNVTVTFSEPVQGINASVLRVNDSAATSVTGSGATYTFGFPQPPFGSVQFSWAQDAFIGDFAAPPNKFERTGANATFLFELVDPSSPMMSSVIPPKNFTVRELREVTAYFNKVVVGVDATDLLVNGHPALTVDGLGAGPYVFKLPPLSPGTVTLSWAQGNQIQDENEPPRALESSGWSYTLAPATALPRVRINENNASNLNGLKDEENSAEDWIELFNEENFSVNLEGWALSDNRQEPGLWILPSITIPARGYLVVFASAKDRMNGGRIHASFKLKIAGEYLGLFSPDAPRREVSAINYPEQRNDLSWGINPDGQWRYYRTPTPGAANLASAITGVVQPVHFSVERGFFSTPFYLTLHSPTPGATVRYTIDGSEPTATTGTNYSGPILIDRIRTVRAAAFEPNSLPSRTETHSYLYNIPLTRTRLPVLSLVTATNHLYGTNGIMEVSPRNTTKRGRAWERPISVEYIRPEDNEGFQIDCGIRLQGGDYIRSLYSYKTTALPASKYSFRLYFRGDYGSGKLNYPLIPDIPLESFDEISLRAGMNDHSNPFIRDELARALSSDVGIVASHGTFVHLYLNGVYKGLYNPAERIGPEFLQSWHGGGEKWDIIAQLNELVEGDMVIWNRMRSLAQNQNPTNAAVYQQILTMLDVENFIDYLLPHIYADTDDWPHNNWRAARERVPGGKFRFYTWDAEFSFGFNNVPASHNTIAGQLSNLSPPWGTTEIQRFFTRLKLSPEFRLTFADRVHKHLFNGGALTDEKVRARYNRMKAVVAPSIVGFTDTIGTTWIPQRRRYLTNHLNSAGFLASSNAPVFNQFGGRISAGFDLTMSAGTGDIWFTTNGVDPRVPFTGAVNPAAMLYSEPLTLHASTLVKARTRWSTNWSAVTEAAFTVEQLGVPLRITELMYNPAGGDAYEYIELQNIGGVAISLANFSFEGVTYRFGTDAPPLTPGARLLLVSDVDPTAFRARYPSAAVHAMFSGNLANGGERITVKDAAGNIVAAVEYDDENGWPVAADGHGHSLEYWNLASDPGSAANWQASARSSGSPGEENSRRETGSVRLNEVFATGTDWVELHNTGTAAVDLGGWSLTDDSNPRRFVFPAGTRMGANEYLVVWCDTATNAAGLHTGFALSQRGENLSLYDAQGRCVESLAFGLQIPEHAVGRGELNARWTLTVPTPGAANESVLLSTNLVINEIMANPLAGQDDWLEIYNADTNAPAEIGDCYLVFSNAVSRLPALSFVPAGGFARIWADETQGPDHVWFKLPAAGGTVMLADTVGAELNRLNYPAQREGVSYGRLPDGSSILSTFPSSASPGAANYGAVSGGVRINEVLAHAATQQPANGRVAGWLEIANPTTTPVSLAGFSLGLNRANPREWRFPDLSLPAQGYLRIWCDPAIPASSDPANLNTGMALNPQGGSVYLFDAAERTVDSVTFGPQIADQPIGSAQGGWFLLSTPTPEGPNSNIALLGDGSVLRLNEWMAAPLVGDDWIELYNPGNLPVYLGGLVLTDDPSILGRTNSRLAHLSFIGPKGFVLLQADEESDAGPEHLNFKLNAFGETLRLYSGTLVIDEVLMLPQEAGVSEGRSPDGATNIARFRGVSTPLARNTTMLTDTDRDGLPDDWELAHGLRTDDPSDAAQDADGDGMSAAAEYRAGTNPKDAFSALRLMGLNFDGSTVDLVFRAAADRSYTILATESLVYPLWSRVQNIASGPARDVRVADGSTGKHRFYRIATPMQP